MTISNQLKLMSLFPDMPREIVAINDDKTFVSGWSLFFDVLIKSLQSVLKPEGFILPSLTATQIATIQAIYAPYAPPNPPQPLPISLPDISGQTVFDSTNRVPKIFVITYDGATPPNITAASWKTFTLT